MADRRYTVKQGDCISSIAFAYNLFPKTIWDHPDNVELKKLRKDPNALFPGDSLVIPEKQLKEEQCQAEQKHRFRRKGVPERLRIQFLTGDEEDDAPRKAVPYTLDITTKSGSSVPRKEGKTDNDGYLDEAIPPDALKGVIIFDEGEDQEVYEIMLGHLDPVGTPSGIKARLENLGYECGEDDNTLDYVTIEAVRKFQADNDLKILPSDFTEIDQDTLDKIEELYSGE
ncbi:MAG: LysM peptidoglycan-binding domain-containing protein [Phycisphaerales bacterium]|nr:MAG: LysM peptidoglycan-binding domain-containing protein [Phycisphaerales bacterium]